MGEARTGGRGVILCGKRLQMAKSAPRLSTVHNSGQLLLRRNPERALGEDPRGAGGTSTDAGRAKGRPQLRNYRLAKRKNRLIRRRTWNRRREKTRGRKRHIVVDTMGNLLAVMVHAANIHDTKSGILAARDAFEKYPSIQRFCADAGYRKSFEQDVSRELGLGVDISARIKPEWEVLPKRWIVERSLAWLNNFRRLSKDYERSVRSAQAVCIIAAFCTLLKRF